MRIIKGLRDRKSLVKYILALVMYILASVMSKIDFFWVTEFIFEIISSETPSPPL